MKQVRVTIKSDRYAISDVAEIRAPEWTMETWRAPFPTLRETVAVGGSVRRWQHHTEVSAGRSRRPGSGRRVV